MKNTFFIFLIMFFVSKSFGQNNSNVITSDIANFWSAFDKITTTKDTIEQYNYLNDLFIKKGSPGLSALIEVKRYTPRLYINAINNYPLFWKSIRENTLKADSYAKEIEDGIDKLRIIYPTLIPAKIYFTVGALWTGGTTYKGKVLIGSELAMTDSSTVTKELPERFSYLPPYFATNPIKETVFLNVHEYVHTQQKTTIGNNLLEQCVLEGVAEFITVIALNKTSPNQCIGFGKKNDRKIKEAFTKEIFSSLFDNWLWNDFNNQFKMRDLGYYVGYAIAEKYYKQATNKKQVIKEMIELDYNNETELGKYVDKSGFFDKSYKRLKGDYENSRPKLINIKEFKNGNQIVNLNLTQITIEFSAVMDKRFRNFELGPLGEKNLLKLKKFIGFSEDGKSASFEIELKPNQQYQIIIGEGFRNDKGISLKPYLVDFKTSDK